MVVADRIYGSRENRRYLKEKGIRFSGVALGRSPTPGKGNAEAMKSEKRRRKQEAKIRSWIEGAFGRGKRGYGLNRIKTKTQATSESYVAAVFFAMNIALALKAHLFDFFISGLRLVKLAYRVIRAVYEKLSKSKGAMPLDTVSMVCQAAGQS